MILLQNIAPETGNTRNSARNRKEHRRTPHFYPVVKDESPPDPKTPRKRKTRHSSNPPVEHHVGWIMDVREHRPRTTSMRLVIVISLFNCWLVHNLEPDFLILRDRCRTCATLIREKTLVICIHILCRIVVFLTLRYNIIELLFM